MSLAFASTVALFNSDMQKGLRRFGEESPVLMVFLLRLFPRVYRVIKQRHLCIVGARIEVPPVGFLKCWLYHPYD